MYRYSIDVTQKNYQNLIYEATIVITLPEEPHLFDVYDEVIYIGDHLVTNVRSWESIPGRTLEGTYGICIILETSSQAELSMQLVEKILELNNQIQQYKALKEIELSRTHTTPVTVNSIEGEVRDWEILVEFGSELYTISNVRLADKYDELESDALVFTIYPSNRVNG